MMTRMLLFCSVLSNRVDQHNYNKYINACIVIGLHSRSSLNDPRELLVTLFINIS